MTRQPSSSLITSGSETMPLEISDSVSGKLYRLDPETCGCTDCIVGNSKPINEASAAEVLLLLDGKLRNATSYNLAEFYLIVDGAGNRRAIIMPWEATKYGLEPVEIGW
jgi:hypothetical protein